MKCDEARRLLLTDAADPRAIEHLEGCRECFEAIEAADPLVPLLVAARPADAAGPSSLATAVLARWRPGRSRLVTAGIAIAVTLVAIAVEALFGVDPARLASLGLGLGAAAASLISGALTAVQTVQSILVGAPAVLAALTALTVLACGTWVKLARSLPDWRPAS